jgi:hypothetical protein
MAKRGTGGGGGRGTNRPKNVDSSGPARAPRKGLPLRQTKISERVLPRPKR